MVVLDDPLLGEAPLRGWRPVAFPSTGPTRCGRSHKPTPRTNPPTELKTLKTK